MSKAPDRKSERVPGPFGPVPRFSVSSSKGNFNKDIWWVESEGTATEKEAIEYARQVWGDKKAVIRNMTPTVQGCRSRVHGASGFPKGW